MNAFIAKAFGILISILSMISLALIVLSAFMVDPIEFGLPSGYGWVVALMLFVLYVLLFGSLAVLINLRELVEKQTELLELLAKR